MVSVLLNLVLSCTILTTFQLLIMSGIAPMGDQILTVKDVADYLKVNERTVYRMAASAKLPAFKVGASWRFKEADIEKWIKEQSNDSDGDN
jgi:excisionase family DNA binding protein